MKISAVDASFSVFSAKCTSIQSSYVTERIASKHMWQNHRYEARCSTTARDFYILQRRRCIRRFVFSLSVTCVTEVTDRLKSRRSPAAYTHPRVYNATVRLESTRRRPDYRLLKPQSGSSGSFTTSKHSAAGSEQTRMAWSEQLRRVACHCRCQKKNHGV